MAILLIALFHTALGEISVISPEALLAEFKERYPSGIISSSMGNFGNPPYGTSLTGQLIIEDSAHAKACTALPPINLENVLWKPIVLVERGDCAFVVKVRNSQTIGAKAVIIINDDNQDPEKIIMTDNGEGGNLEIPAFLIRKDDGQLLRSYHSWADIAMHLSFDVISYGQNVNLTVWTQSSSVSGMRLLSDLAKTLPKMEGLWFLPHFFVWNCNVCEQIGYVNTEVECISGGRYCAYDPDGSAGKAEGRDIVMEDLRQICIFNVLKEKDKARWLRYVSEFYKNCMGVYTRECSEKCMNAVGVRKESVQKCVDESVDGSELLLDDNKVMRSERIEWNRERIPFNPALVINGQLYRGDLEAESVIKAICASYEAKYRPGMCSGDGGDTENSSGNEFWVVVVVIAVLLLIISMLILYRLWLNRELKHDMKLQVGEAVAHYFQLAEVSKK